MDQSLEILSYLNRLGIPCTLFEHEPKTTIEACQNIEGVDWSTSAMCKRIPVKPAGNTVLSHAAAP